MTDTFELWGSPMAALRSREDAIDRVDHNASSEWMALALEALDHVRRMNPVFTSHTVWDRLDALKVPAPHEESAMGAVFRRAAKAGKIAKTGRYVASTRPQCHREIAQWTSA
jgi:hypothetical protein